MKKIFFSMLALVAFTAVLVSCGDDDNKTNSASPAAAAAGTYLGKWFLYTDEAGTNLKAEYNGSITLGEKDRYVATINTKCPDFSDPANTVTADDIINNKNGVVNISWAGDEYVKFESRTNGAGTMAYQEVASGVSQGLYAGLAGSAQSGILTTSLFTYQVSKRVGRSVQTFKYYFKFVGTKGLLE